MRRGVFVLLLAGACTPASASITQPPAIDWNDGRAELSGYELVQPRYGEQRTGAVALVWVREDFSESARVKADAGNHPREDVFPVLKLNVVKHFQTGLYRYNLMSSVFTAFDAHGGRSAGVPAKLVFSNQEWCGALFEELLFDADKIRAKRFSYFDGEGDASSELGHPQGGISVDAMPTLARAIHGALVEPGGSRELPVLPSLERVRLTHRKLAWQKGKLSRSASTKRTKTPLGELEIETWTLELGDGDRYEYDVERAGPRRLIEWRGPEGERGRIRGSTRLPYWTLHANGDERYLEQLGLTGTMLDPRR
jgi:hypothetical protein